MIDVAKLTPLGARILVRPTHPTHSEGGILLPSAFHPGMDRNGEVVALGLERSKTGAVIPSDLKCGMRIHFRAAGVNEIQINGVLHFLVDKHDVWAILE